MGKAGQGRMGLASCSATLIINLNLWQIQLKLCIFFWRFVGYFQVTMHPHILRNPYVTQFCRNKPQKQERQDCQEKVAIYWHNSKLLWFYLFSLTPKIAIYEGFVPLQHIHWRGFPLVHPHFFYKAIFITH